MPPPGYAGDVTAEIQRVLEAAMKLPDDERAAPVTVFTDTLGAEGSDEEIEAAWIAGAKRRLAEIEAGRSKPVPREKVSERLRARVEQAKRGTAMDG